MRTYVVALLILSAVSGLAQAVNPEVTLQISGGVSGTIVLELFKDQAPNTVANFINYVKSGFYDGLIFHRVIPDFMIQGGGFDTNLVYKNPLGFILNESTNRLSNLRGTLAMARGNHPDSAGSQFYINTVNNNGTIINNLDFTLYVVQSTGYYYYDPGYCVFGQVVSGMNVVDAISAVTTSSQTSSEGVLTDVPVTDIIIQSATVTVDTLCDGPLQGDVNSDCEVNLSDLLLMSQNWMVNNVL